MAVEWYYAKGDQQLGPVSPTELKRLADAGELQPDDLVWRDGMEDWKAANHVKKLFRRIQPPEPELPGTEPPAGTTIPGGPAAPPGSASSDAPDLSGGFDTPDFAAPSAPPSGDAPAAAGSEASDVSAPGGVPAAPASAFGAAVPTPPDASGPVPPAVSGSSSGAIPAPPIDPSGAIVLPRDSQQVSASQESIGPPPPSGRTAPVQSPWAQAAGGAPAKARPAGRHFFDALLDGVRPGLTPALVDSLARIFSVMGHFGLYAAMVAGALFPVVVGAGSARILVFGLVWILTLLVLQYVAERFTAVLRRLNRQTSGRLSSTAFPDSFAVLAMVAGLAALAVLVMPAVRDGEYVLIFLGLAVFVVGEFAALVSLVPACLSIEVVPRTAPGEEAIGVFSFLIKLLARVVPVAFGAGVLYGTIAVLLACYAVPFVEIGPAGDSEAAVVGQTATAVDGDADPADLWAEPPVKPFFAEYEGALAGRIPIEQSALRAMRLIVLFALLPFAVYVLFLAYYLSVDLIRSVLAVPWKLDKLLKEKEESGERTEDSGQKTGEKEGSGEKEEGRGEESG